MPQSRGSRKAAGPPRRGAQWKGSRCPLGPRHPGAARTKCRVGLVRFWPQTGWRTGNGQARPGSSREAGPPLTIVVGALFAIVATLIATIAAFWIELGRRRDAEAALRASEQLLRVDVSERQDAMLRIRDSQSNLESSHREIQKLAGRLIEAQETERARVARDLRDHVSRELAEMWSEIGELKQRLAEARVSEELEWELSGLQARITGLGQNVRHLSHGLHPTVLQHGGLVAALKVHCAELQRTVSSPGTQFTCSADGDFGSVPEDSALCLYRVAQEALRNVICHACASRASVQLERARDWAEMTIADDGRGFDLARSLERCEGLGLMSIQERVRLVGGSVTIDTAWNRGTRVRVRIPAPSLATLDVDLPLFQGRQNEPNVYRVS